MIPFIDDLGFRRTAPRFGVMIGQPAHAILVEDLGFDSLWVGDHIHFRVPTREALTVLAMMAAKTERIHLGTAVLQTPMRHPFMLAKIAATLQELSGDRLQLGLGVGGDYAPEFAVLGVPSSERGSRTDESLTILKALLGGERVDYSGRHFNIEAAEIVPSVTSPPILVGGRSDAALRRTARFADGYFPYLVSPEQVRMRMDRLAGMLSDEGRRPDSLTAGCNLLVLISLDDDPDRGMSRAAAHLSRLYGMSFDRIASRYCIAGPPDACARRIAEYWRSGVDEFTFQVLGPSAEGTNLETEHSLVALASVVGAARSSLPA